MPAMAKTPDLDEATRKIAERLLNMPPKQHKDMKLGKLKEKRKSVASSKPKSGAPSA